MHRLPSKKTTINQATMNPIAIANIALFGLFVILFFIVANDIKKHI